MKQLQAGYFIETVTELYSTRHIEEQFLPLLKKLSCFDIETETDISHRIKNSSVAVINNIITRGTPTRPSIFIGDLISRIFSQTVKRTNAGGNIRYNFVAGTDKELINKVFHIIDPRIKIKYPTKYMSETEKFKIDFIFNDVLKYTGDYFLQEINLLDKKNKFTIEPPYSNNNKKAIVIETDVDADIINVDYILIEKKRKELEKQNINYLYVKKGQTETVTSDLQYFTYNEYFDIIKKNFLVPLYNRTSGLDMLQIVLAPFAIARIQKTVIEFILAGKLKLNVRKLKIAVIERDVPAGYLAFEDLKQQFENLYILQGKKIYFPKIELDIYYSKEFKNAKLNNFFKGNKKDITEFDKNKFYDLLIDISMLQKTGFDDCIPETKAKNKVKIRSVNSVNSTRKFYTSKLIFYDALKFRTAVSLENKTERSLKFFLQNIFRKNNFYDNQINAIRKALTLESFTQISPPGSGKTLIYQFAAIMQAGISIAVLPDTNILREHYNDLQNENIDGTCYINSSNYRCTENTKALNKFGNGESLITFVSSEKFKEISFKENINKLFLNKIYFSYFVIDEIQCISEFSCDFRPAYKELAKFAFDNCKTKNIRKIPIIGLGTTATYNVKKDIISNTNINSENFLIYKNDKRKINYKVIKTNEKHTTVLQLLEETKSNTLIVSPDIKKIYEINDENYADITDIIQTEHREIKTESYFGTIDARRNYVEKEEAYSSEENYFNFKNNNINILTVNESVCNFKKSDIRRIIFMNLPESLENFYKIIGCAGRDGKPANIYVLYDDTVTEIFENTYAAKSNGKPEQAELILNITKDSIVQRQKLNRTYQSRKKEINVLHEIIDIINKKHKEFKFNKITKINLMFSNNVLNNTIKMLDKHLPDKFDVKDVEKAYNSNNYHTGFINSLNEVYRTKLVNDDIDIDVELETMFYNHRDQNDTEIALYRLQTISYIESYEINLKEKYFVIYLMKKQDRKYIEALSNYLQKYLSARNYLDFSKKINAYTDTTTLKKCVNYLINYIYDNIVVEKYKQIEYIDELCSTLSIDKSIDKEIRKKTNTFLDNIFYSKYINNILRPSLALECSNFQKENFYTVLRFMRDAGNSLCNCEHLYVSSEKALSKNPENFTFLLLNAYARFWRNPDDEKNYNIAFERLTKGFLLMKQKEILSLEQILDRKNNFLEKLYEQNNKLKANIEPIFFLKTHINWLNDFNKKFLSKN